MGNKNKFYFIYKTTNLKNGKYYIGMHVTSNLDDGYLGSGKILRNSIYFHGKENFKREIIEFCNDKLSLIEKEREIVNEDLINEAKCMNLVVGGQGGYGFFSDEHEKNFIEAGKKNLINSETKRKNILNKKRENVVWLNNVNKKVSKSLKEYYKTNNSGFKDKKHNKTTIKILSKSKNVGIHNSQFGTIWITNGSENIKLKKNETIPLGWWKGRIINKNKMSD